MAVLAIFAPDRRASIPLTSALSGRHRLVPCATWNALRMAIQREEVEACLVAWPPLAGCHTAADRIADLRTLCPGVGIVACVEPGDLTDRGVPGVDGVVGWQAEPARIRADIKAVLNGVRAGSVQPTRMRHASRAGTAAGFSIKPALQRAGSLLSMTVLAGCAMLGGGGVDGSAIRDVLQTEPIDQLHVGVYAIDLASGRTLFSHNAHRKFIPASNQKILVTATAMSLFGPDHRFRTDVWAAGDIAGSFVDGDVVVVGSGDPTFSDRYWTSGADALRAIADSLTSRGVRHVGGRLIVDVTAWDSASVGPTWEVEDLRYGYGSTGGAFGIDEGELDLVVSSGPSVGDPAPVSWSPLGTRDFVRSRLTTAPVDSSTRVRPDYLPESRVLVLEGRVEFGTVDTVSIAMRDPVRQSAASLARAVDDAGIEVEGGLRIRWTRDVPDQEPCTLGDESTCPGSQLLFSMHSPPVSKIAAGILEPSQNWMTEQTVRALGARYGDQGSWREGVDVVEAFLVNEVGVRPSDISARDGSGLSFYNLVTPRAIVRILTEMHQMPWAAEYRDAMAEPGEEDSTLENRLKGLEGRLFAKTGTISNVNSLSGYLVRENGQEIAFSILSNGSGMPASRVRRAIDEIVRALAHEQNADRGTVR